ncbi:NAD(P)-dependent oxidoreductase [Treponema sp. Marseille-Q4523]|uniref:NAD-dependent epimerase/dehydratase family protein n=1 Tax=Treponema sp. Marseille-Q4523 TaxID=2810610 RepID=UPI001961CF4A|nr:NAD(P)-dependent oxidoreductase [Treponema sp. Marseille-Q4523]MBM7023991.1 NAD(P)-dependent oxidoreductase [Treponema sp. Marseille-Q4523]
MQKIVISGATGILGSALIRCAKKQGLEIVCIVRKDSERAKALIASNSVDILQADLKDYNTLSPVITNSDVFIHLAWEKTFGTARDDVDAQVRNIQYTLDAARLAQRMGCKVFIGAGSQAEYGPVQCPLTDKTPVCPQSGYGMAKYTAGRLSALLCGQLGIRHNWLRILSLYGPNDAPYTLISYVIHELKNGRSPELTKCEQVWDYLYADDAAQAILAVAQKGIHGKTYPLGSGTARKLSEYIKVIRDYVNPDIAIHFGVKDYYPHQPMYLQADITELTKDTGWKPEISFLEGLENIVASTLRK